MQQRLDVTVWLFSEAIAAWTPGRTPQYCSYVVSLPHGQGSLGPTVTLRAGSTSSTAGPRPARRGAIYPCARTW